jgi:hypothetical protein
MSDTVVWSADTNETVLLPSTARDAAIRGILIDINNQSTDPAVTENRQNVIIGWVDRLPR